MQITILNGAVEYDGEPILSEINFSIHEKEKIAIVGRNGCGKTTLLKLLTGEVQGVQGTGTETFSIMKSGEPNIGFLKQATNDELNKTMFDEILEAYKDLIALGEEVDKLSQKLQTNTDERTIKRYTTLLEQFEFLGGYTYKKEYMTAIKKFGFLESDLQKPLNEFSGGQRTKIALLKLLLSKPDILLLDEPTNHLDLKAIEWLEKYIKEYKKSCVIVSHDRMFLDNTVNIVYEIEYGELTRYKGNYSSFVIQKRENFDTAMKDALLRKKEIERLSQLVERFRYKANKAAFAQSKIKAIERIGNVDIPTGYDNATFKASFDIEQETVDKTIIFDKLSFGYDKVFGTIDTIVKRGEKVGIIGKNGTGKSTLVKTLMGKVKALGGKAIFGLHANVGYFDQTLSQSYKECSVFDDFQGEFPYLNDREVRTCLGAFLFTGEDVFKRVCDLSGGEKVRLSLCKIFKRKPNVLILDEPTNHMDIIGKETLETMLKNYTGTVITVSHDRYFINTICNRIISFEDDGLKLFDGNYRSYEEQKSLLEQQQEQQIKIQTENVEIIKKEKPISSEKEKNKKLHRIGVLEEKMSVIETEIEKIKKQMSEDSTIYSDYKKLNEKQQEIDKFENELAPLSTEWEKLMEEII